MNDVTRPPPPPQDPEDIDDGYRRASATDPSRPSPAIRRAILAHAAKVAAERESRGNAFLSWLKGLSRGWSGPALVGTLAAAVFAGMMILPRVQMLHQAREAMEAPKRVEAPPASEPVTVQLQPQERLPEVPLPSMKAPGPSLAAPPPASPALAPGEVSGTRRREVTQDSPAAITAIDSDELSAGASTPTQESAGAAAAPARDSVAARSSAATTAAQAGTAPTTANDSKSSKALEEVVMTGSRITRDEVRRNSEFWRAAEKGDLSKLQALLAQGVFVNTRDSKGRTALLLAIQHRHADIVNALLEKDADPTLPDNKGITPLKAALDSGQTEVADTLRHHGAQ